MNLLLPRALELFAGAAVYPVTRNTEVRDPALRAMPAVFALSPSRKLVGTLRDKGYTHFRSFLALPSFDAPRWLIPADDRCSMLAGTDIYHPHKRAARAIKKVLTALMKMGWEGRCCSQVLLASAGGLGFEALVHAVTGEARPLFALSFGRQPAVRKLTVQVMRANGELLGYMKLPLAGEAIERVRNEAIIVERLSKFSALKPHIPRLLYAGNWNGTYLLFQSALEGELGPLTLSEVHESFLRRLRLAHSVDLPGQSVVHAVAAKWEKAVPRLDSEWRQLGNEVLRRATYALHEKALRCSVMHGDFAPWNTRVRQEDLLLFDWESASWEAPVSWDVFHFQVQTSYFFRKNKIVTVTDRDASDDVSFTLYALRYVCQFLEEQNESAMAHYKGLLTNALLGRYPSVEIPCLT